MLLATGCSGVTRYVTKTEQVEAPTSPAITAPVPVPRIDVRTNEDLDRKALAMERALEECNARLIDARISQGSAAASPTPQAPWWRRLFGGSP